MSIDPSRIRISGPLAAFAAGFADHLVRQGYRSHAARKQIWLLAHLSRWLVRECLGAAELNTTEAERFLLARRAAGYKQLLSMKATQPILAYLRGLGVAPIPSPPTPSGPVEVTLERYRSYLTVERGLGAETARGYVDAVRLFLLGRVPTTACLQELRWLYDRRDLAEARRDTGDHPKDAHYTGTTI